MKWIIPQSTHTSNSLHICFKWLLLLSLDYNLLSAYCMLGTVSTTPNAWPHWTLSTVLRGKSHDHLHLTQETLRVQRNNSTKVTQPVSNNWATIVISSCMPCPARKKESSITNDAKQQKLSKPFRFGFGRQFMVFGSRTASLIKFV